MVVENPVPLRSRLAAAAKAVCRYGSAVPVAVRIALGLFLIVALFLITHTAVAAKDASVRLKVQHSFRSAQLTLWVDGNIAYSGKLVGYTKKKFGLIPESVQGSLTQTVAVPSGKHELRIRVAADDGSVEEERIAGEFSHKVQNTLTVNARRSELSLGWQSSGPGAQSALGAAGTGEYASTLLLTVAGSIMSALTGYAIKELPNYLRNRQPDVSKT